MKKLFLSSTFLIVFILSFTLNLQSAPTCEPIVVPGNPTCSDLGTQGLCDCSLGFKINLAPNGKFFFVSADGELMNGAPEDPNNFVVIYSSDGVTFNWYSSLGIDAVIVKGGKLGANVYIFENEMFSGQGFTTPTSQDISHINFCFDYEVTVKKTAIPTFTRTFEWYIQKSVTPAVHKLFAGETTTSTYTVGVKKTGYTDSDWAVNGSITILNNTPFEAIIEEVADTISNYGTITTECADVISFPYTIAPGDSIVCTYQNALPDAMERFNTVFVYTSGFVGGDSTKADIVFGEPTTKVNTEINVTDTNGKSWGPVSGDMSWTYPQEFSCSADPEAYVANNPLISSTPNTATIVETQQTADASVTVKCYAPVVEKDALTGYIRTWNWSIDKSADQTEITLSSGQSYAVNYKLLVDAAYTDSDWSVNGAIAVKNPHPTRSMNVSLSDVVAPDIVATLECGGTLTIPAGETAICTYKASLPNADQRLNTVTVKLNELEFKATADVIFGTPTAEVDECIQVFDSNLDPTLLGEVCATKAPATFSYSNYVGPYLAPDQCGDHNVINTASFKTNDQDLIGKDSWTVLVHVPCETGCTLTQGYWKTHSDKGPAPFDETWAQLPDTSNTVFFYSSQSYYEVMQTPPKGGNAYYILAPQYIAAELNMMHGADPTDALEAFNAAKALFDNPKNTPEAVKKLKNNDRDVWIKLATTLDAYNNGLIGPGHCDENNGDSPEEPKLRTSDKNQEKPAEESIIPSNDEKNELAKSEADSPEWMENGLNAKPKTYALRQNHPNPFNPSTTLTFELPAAGQVSLTIYNLAGQEIATIVNEHLDAGQYSFTWQAPLSLPSGMYFYRIQTADFTATRKMLLMR